jgi:hypothetical protein
MTRHEADISRNSDAQASRSERFAAAAGGMVLALLNLQ